ncbi:Stp1/IreP family PP2C-type Ser/Thr phosphatase [Gudongella sp. DL1XJH-153]|uniref:Stp1/IreP family PP2C-type Ser/Thr phosphatase n=1 Tax=Gudongella sp. DL1XJH-153 TaxID=3409804 RepID=UPI003BB6990F
MKFGAASDIGLVREINQDSLYIPENQHMPLFMVADGMGGHNAGEIASVMAINIIKEWMEENIADLTTEKNIRECVIKSVEYANRHIYNYSKEIEGCRGMGTTLTMGYLCCDKIVVGHVGDSRAYLISSGKMSQITQDHSLVQQLLQEGKISENEARTHPQRNVITRAVGTSSEIEVDTLTIDITKGDIVVFCSDGLTNMVPEEKLIETFSNETDIQRACEIAVEKAKVEGGNDNITVLGIRF